MSTHSLAAWLSKSSVAIVAGSVLLVGAVLAQTWGARQKQPSTWAPLAQQLPSALPAWSVRDIPVAESPEVQKAAETILRYDDVVFREYRRGDFTVQVYASAWSPGKMDARDVAIHNPDNCWTANGFTRLDDASKALSEVAGLPVATGQFRRFETRGNQLEVAYWLMVDGKPFGTVDESTRVKALLTRVTAFCRTVWFGLMAKGKRSPIYFVRLSSPRNLETVLADPTLQPLVSALRPLIGGPAGPR